MKTNDHALVKMEALSTKLLEAADKALDTPMLDPIERRISVQTYISSALELKTAVQHYRRGDQ